MLAQRKKEAAEEREERRFDGWMRTVTGDDDWQENCTPEEIDELAERFDEWLDSDEP